ncbi:hypothetical protein KKF34_03935 [Myxococcota bacterium]|nr:hypothetical protein [Myxococcota bacterium]MBU1382710.1 hypothetical protein [Myxococcota bacterium]MBU1496006.1 hypothetical protein [Myxococcota bacterium]
MLYLKHLILISSLFVFSCSGNNSSSFPGRNLLQEGDIILQSIPCGDLCNSIEKATKLKNYHGISHAGVFTKHDGKDYVIEAYGSVKRTPLNEFIKRSRKKSRRQVIYIVRLKKEYQTLIPFFIKELEKRLGKPYDDIFMPDNDRYYCSELISDSFLTMGLKILPRHPMFFGKKSGKEYRVFQEYFAKKNLVVPEGKPGTNPASLLNLPAFDIIYNFER